MEDFFKNKLNEFEESGDGWDKPDPEVWEQAQRQIFVPAGRFPVAGILIKSGVALLVLLLGGYIWHLHQDHDELKKSLENQQQQITQLTRQIAAAEQANQEKQQLALIENEKLKAENAAISQQNQAFRQQLERQRNPETQFSPLQKFDRPAAPAATDETEKLSNNATPPAALTQEKPAAVEVANISRLPEKPIAFEVTEPLPLTVPAQTTPLKNAEKRFEIGYEYALLGLKIPVQSDFKDQNAISDQVNKTVFTHSHGVYFAFSPKQNWFVRTGLRTAEMTLEQSRQSGVYYDKSGEYLKPDGATANDVSLALRTPYSQLESEITLAIPTDANLKTGDWLVFGTFERLRQRHYQVPFGISWFQGNKRLQLQLSGGVQWNLVVFDNYFLKAWVESKSIVLPVDEVKLQTKDVPSSQYLGAYAGFGLNYRLTQSWHLRSGLSYHYDFNQKSSKFSNSREIGSAFSLGLNYRF